jgi:hypothetical protein
VVLAFASPSASSGAAVLYSSFSRRFSPGRAKIVEKKEEKYLAAAGNSGVAGAIA